MDSYGQDDEFRGGWVFCHIFEKYQGYFFAKKRGGGVFCQIRKLPGYFFKVEGVGGGERHDFRKPIICPIKKSLPPPPRSRHRFFRRIKIKLDCKKNHDSILCL